MIKVKFKMQVWDPLSTQLIRSSSEFSDDKYLIAIDMNSISIGDPNTNLFHHYPLSDVLYVVSDKNRLTSHIPLPSPSQSVTNVANKFAPKGKK